VSRTHPESFDSHRRHSFWHHAGVEKVHALTANTDAILGVGIEGCLMVKESTGRLDSREIFEADVTLNVFVKVPFLIAGAAYSQAGWQKKIDSKIVDGLFFAL
jgi:hypothetical protein